MTAGPKAAAKIEYIIANATGRLKKLNAEILQVLISGKCATFLATSVWCRNSASLASGLKTLDAEILQILLSANFATIHSTTV